MKPCYLPCTNGLGYMTNSKLGTEHTQAFTDISCSAQCCHNNETRAPIANPPNSAQPEGTPYHSPKLHPGSCTSVGMQRRTDRHTDTQMAVTNIHFTSALPHVKCNTQSSAHCFQMKLFINSEVVSKPLKSELMSNRHSRCTFCCRKAIENHVRIVLAWLRNIKLVQKLRIVHK